MWKPRNKWQLQTKGGCESSGSGSESGSGIAILNFVTINPATGEVIFDENNSSDPAAFYDACANRKPVMVFWDLDPFRHVEADGPSNMVFSGHPSEMKIVFNALTKSINILSQT